MNIGQRIKMFRIKRGMTQKDLGLKVGYNEKNADVRIAQYETSIRTPSFNKKANKDGISEPAIRNYELGNRKPSDSQIERISKALGISPLAIANPVLDTNNGLMHTLFWIEYIYGLEIKEHCGQFAIVISNDNISDYLKAWYKKIQLLKKGLISQAAYDDWRYNFPHGYVRDDVDNA